MIANDKINRRFIGSCANEDHCVSRVAYVMCVSAEFRLYWCNFHGFICFCIFSFFIRYLAVCCPRQNRESGNARSLPYDGRLKTNFHRNENLLSKFKIGNGHPIGIYLSWTLVSRKPNGQEYNPMMRTITKTRKRQYKNKWRQTNKETENMYRETERGKERKRERIRRRNNSFGKT